MTTITYTSREEIEVHRFSALATIGIPLLAQPARHAGLLEINREIGDVRQRWKARCTAWRVAWSYW